MLWRAARGGLLSRNALCRVPSIAPTANIPRPGRSPQPRSKGAGRCPRRGSGEREARRARATSRSALPEATCQLGRERRCRELLSELRNRNVQTNTPLERRWLSETSGRPGGFGYPSSPRLLDSISVSSLFLTFLAAQSALLFIFSPREISKTNPRLAPESS